MPVSNQTTFDRQAPASLHDAQGKLVLTATPSSEPGERERNQETKREASIPLAPVIPHPTMERDFGSRGQRARPSSLTETSAPEAKSTLGESLAQTVSSETQVFQLRMAYQNDVRQLEETGQALLVQGHPKEHVARTLHQARRNIGEKYKNLRPPELREQIYTRNVEKYGDRLGPTIDYLRNTKNKSWDEIIESATKPGGADLKEVYERAAQVETGK